VAQFSAPLCVTISGPVTGDIYIDTSDALDCCLSVKAENWTFAHSIYGVR